MIDAETKIYDSIVRSLREKYSWASNIRFANDYVQSPSSFPFVTIIERENRTDIQTMESSNTEVLGVLDYEVNVYTNSQAKRKQEARKIASAVDAELLALGFRRRTMEQVPNLANASVYRILARYTVHIEEEDDEYILYRRP